jgi:hypothetical protein
LELQENSNRTQEAIITKDDKSGTYKTVMISRPWNTTGQMKYVDTDGLKSHEALKANKKHSRNYNKKLKS